MIAHYGYQDGSGTYYISIDTDVCIGCAASHACAGACPQQVFEIIQDDYDDTVACVRTDLRRQLATLCSICKPAVGALLPCVAACMPGALEHSW